MDLIGVHRAEQSSTPTELREESNIWAILASNLHSVLPSVPESIPISPSDGPHPHRTDEALHSNNSATWQSIYESLQRNTLSVGKFYNQSIGKDKHFEGTLGDGAHTTQAADVSKQAAAAIHGYLPQEKALLLSTIESLIEAVKAIPESNLRRKVKFAVDRLLRDNENDVASNFNSRQLLLASWQYLQRLAGGPNSAELKAFWLALQSYIDSGDYPTATMGDVSTQAHFDIGVFAGDTEVSSDAGLHPACYGRMRNISSTILAIHHAVESKQRMIDALVDSPVRQEKVIGMQRRIYVQQALSMLKILNQNKEYLPDPLSSKMIKALDYGLCEAKDTEVLVNWFKQYNPSYDESMLQISLSMTCRFEELLLDRQMYIENEAHQAFFEDIKQGLQLQNQIITFLSSPHDAASAPTIT